MTLRPTNVQSQVITRTYWAILVIAVVLRLWGIDYGLPYVYWTDEYHEVMRAMELGAGGFNLERTGKGGFYLLLFVEYGVFFLVQKVTGAIGSTKEFAELFVNDPTIFYVLGRVTAALIGCVTVAFTFLLTRQAFGARAGLLAALFLAVNLLHVDLSHRVGVDVPMTMFATMALYFGIRIAEGGGRRDYLLAGLSAALATTTKLPGIVVLLPLVIAHAYNIGGSSQWLRRLIVSPNAWVALVLFLVVWVATNPGIVLADDFFSVFADSSGDVSEEFIEGTIRPNLWLFYLEVLRTSMGWPLLLSSLGGVAYALWKRTPADLMLVAYALVNYLAISSTTSENLYFPRYALPIIVVLSVLAARAIFDLIASSSRWRPAIASGATVCLVAWPLVQSIEYSYSLTQVDTRTLARDWMDTNVPKGSKILIEGGKIAASRLTVPLEDSPQSLERRIDYWKTVEPRQAKYLQIRRSVHDGKGFELELVRISTILPLTEYLDRGVEYFVIRPDSFQGSRKADSRSAVFLRTLRGDSRIKLVARFEAGDSLRQGPPIEIYQLKRLSRQET